MRILDSVVDKVRIRVLGGGRSEKDWDGVVDLSDDHDSRLAENYLFDNCQNVRKETHT